MRRESLSLSIDFVEISKKRKKFQLLFWVSTKEKKETGKVNRSRGNGRRLSLTPLRVRGVSDDNRRADCR